MNRLLCRRLFGLAAGSVLLLCLSAGAALIRASIGPPMLCTAIKIGEAHTLPAVSEVPAGYARSKLTSETLALLEGDTPVLARMETIRRAVLLGAADSAVLLELQCKLQGRVLDAEARGKEYALAWFDAGYMAATWNQLDPERAPEVGLAEGCVGYAWVKKALAISKGQAEMEFAAAMATHPAMHKGTHELYHQHLGRAAGGAAKGSLLEQNLMAHCLNWNESYDELKQKDGPERDTGRDR